ncbi:hypothetical protein [Vibrio anguillarum]|uniref:hypothetical protein n=1 Tax=Vibrio anguillarum TaxID=55601 RepID=UPI001C9C63B4|nr:hypothetical protein [Vibrio anguillarum]MBY7667230.1 hypothetical protein [Vibrio anguillarum]
MKTPQSNQATPKLLGFIYQVLVSIEKCFDADSNQTIYIECFGDVSDDESSTEVKHHFDDGNLSDNAVDFWKTLKNAIQEDTSHFSKLFLHTTQLIPDNGIFFDWNKKSANEKYKKIKSVTPTKTIKPFYDFIFSHNKKDILYVLSKFELHGSQFKIQDFIEKLLDHALLCLAPIEQRKDILLWINGYMFNRAIKDRYLWHVDINEFREDIATYVSQFQREDIQFPYVKASEVNHLNQDEFFFLQELESIGIKKLERLTAVSDYLRMKKSEIELLTKKPILMEDAIVRFEGGVSQKISDHKSKIGRVLSIDDIGTDKCKNASNEAYFNFKLNEKINIVHVENTEDYFMMGKAHHLIEVEQLTWNYTEDDLL